ncbi:ABC transporter ATP-binding protein [Niallia nealsonii]|uniref:ABC transporter n=1 Tax=Niallia nealsonii TaxID=115979 RepID=A0A2N0Z3X9_9BACI|nr:ABC transporter ATP-binding protein [Niallia nealsonii]PKG24222.1 ABC transporter [Niallia nealsonii]
MKLIVEHLTFSHGTKKIVDDISLHIKKGEFVGLIGPNGSGKSTILKNIYRTLTPVSGQSLLDGENLYQMSRRKTAKKIGVLGQENHISFDFKVEEMVAMGRSPHKGLFTIDTKEDRNIVYNALKKTGIENMAKINYMNLSGGEKQRVLIARVLAQETDFLILDEPTNHLDINYQLQMFDSIRELGVTVLAAIHDLNLAALYCDRIYVIHKGQVYKAGKPKDILTEETLLEVFGIHTDVAIHPITNKVAITYLPRNLNR